MPKTYEITNVSVTETPTHFGIDLGNIQQRMLDHENAKTLARELTGCYDPVDIDDGITFKGKGLTIDHNYYQDHWVIWYRSQVEGTSYGNDLQFIAKIESMRKEQALKPTINRAMLEEFIESCDALERDEWYGTEQEFARDIIDQFYYWLDGK